MNELNLSENSKIRRSPFLGCIADDFTGATDIASNLRLGGMNVVLTFGLPNEESFCVTDADAIVVALKSRSVASQIAIEESLAVLERLRRIDVQRFYFKYCSTFDSTKEGNIGPVAEALLDRLNAKQTIFCPAFPTNGRTVYQGHHFVNGVLLDQSGMENHPINPMRDSNVVSLLEQQSKKKVGLLPYECLATSRIVAHFRQLAEDDVAFVVCDACDDQHLKILANSIVDMTLLTGGSGLARFLPAAWQDADYWQPNSSGNSLEVSRGRTAIFAGSCSAATYAQIKHLKSVSKAVDCAMLPIDVEQAATSPDECYLDLVRKIELLNPTQNICVYSTSNPESVKVTQQKHGANHVAKNIECLLSRIAVTACTNHDCSRLVLAGGETSGAIVQALGVMAVTVGDEICPGVPWTQTLESDNSLVEHSIGMVLKSGNFGSDDFFEKTLGFGQ